MSKLKYKVGTNRSDGKKEMLTGNKLTIQLDGQKIYFFEKGELTTLFALPIETRGLSTCIWKSMFIMALGDFATKFKDARLEDSKLDCEDQDYYLFKSLGEKNGRRKR